MKNYKVYYIENNERIVAKVINVDDNTVSYVNLLVEQFFNFIKRLQLKHFVTLEGGCFEQNFCFD